MHEKKCVSTKNIEGCDIASSPTTCNACKMGYYVDQKTSKCHKCHPSCLACSGPNDTDCISCSPDKYGLYLDETDLAQTTSRLIGSGSIKKCVTECPAVFGSKQFKVDEFVRECYELNESEKRPIQKYSFSRNTQSISWSNMFQDSLEFTTSYYKYLDQISEDLEEWASNNREDVKLLSKTCNYRGVL